MRASLALAGNAGAAAGGTGGTGGGTGGGSTTTFSPVAGSYSAAANDSVSYLLTASAAVVWNWSASASIGLSATLSSGSSGTSIEFIYEPFMGPSVGSKATTVTVTVGTNTWTILLEADNTNYDPSGGPAT